MRSGALRHRISAGEKEGMPVKRGREGARERQRVRRRRRRTEGERGG